MNRFDKLRESSKKSFEEYNNEADKLKVLSDDAKRVAKISKFDVEILFVAVAMQCTRQLILNALNKRTDDKTAAKKERRRRKSFPEPSLFFTHVM